MRRPGGKIAHPPAETSGKKGGEMTEEGARRTVSVLGGEEGYTAKYGLSPREFPRAQPEGTPEGSGHICRISRVES